MQEGCRFPPGKILHDLLQDECVACKRATKGISWRWRSPRQPRQQQRSTWQQRQQRRPRSPWQQRQQRRPRSPWEQRQHHGWALCCLFTGGLCGDCRDNGPPTASSLVPNMSAKKKMGRVARGQPFDNFGKCTAEGFVIYNEIKAIVKSNQSLLQPRHTLRQGRVAKPT